MSNEQLQAINQRIEACIASVEAGDSSKMVDLVSRFEVCMQKLEGGAPVQAASGSAQTSKSSAGGLGGAWAAATGDSCNKLKEACATLGQAIITQQCDIFIEMVGK